MKMIHVLDLNFLEIDHAIASFLIESSEGPILVESGPYSTYSVLEKRVREAGFDISEIKNVLLTHIHFDHAGAAWALAEKGAKIYVHPFGAPHLETPFKLYNSAKQIYGDEMERLWGEMKDIHGDQLKPTEHEQKIEIGEHIITALHSPGHAKHHIAWKLDNNLFTGDVAGVKIGDGPVVPPCPPPDINLEDWNNSIDLMIESNAQKLFLTHFGVITEIGNHFHELKDILNDWAIFVKGKWEEGLSVDAITPIFTEYTANQLRAKGVSEHGVKQYEAANPSWMSVAGLVRYWKKNSPQE